MSMAPGCPATCRRCQRTGVLHHEAGEHYCTACDNFTAGHRLDGCPGMEPEEEVYL